MPDLTRDEIPMVAVYRRTRRAENRLATMIIGLPAALLIGFLLPFVAPWLALAVIAGQASGIFLGAILTTLFKGPVGVAVSPDGARIVTRASCAFRAVPELWT